MSNIERSLDHYYCDVIISYNSNLPFEDVAGIAHPVNLWRTFNVINVVYGNGTDDNFKYWPKDYIVKVTEHELGHAFGLNHIQSSGVESHDTCDAPEKQLSIMYWCTPIKGDWQKMGITKYDVNAVIQRYTDTGFGELNTKAGSSYTLTNIETITTITQTPISTNSIPLKPNQTTIQQTEDKTTNATISTPDTIENTRVQIPNWIHNNAKWWHDNAISDNDFEKGIQYLIQHGVLTVSQTLQESKQSHQIPSWIKNNAGWWADGQIADDEFVKGIQWLVSNGVIKT